MPSEPAMLDQLIELLERTPCQHCGRQPYPTTHRSAPAVAWDEVSPEEHLLWARYLSGKLAALNITAAEQSLTQITDTRAALRSAQIDRAEAHRRLTQAEENSSRAAPIIGRREHQEQAQQRLSAAQAQAARADDKVAKLEDKLAKHAAEQSLQDRIAKMQPHLDHAKAAEDSLRGRLQDLLTQVLDHPRPPHWAHEIRAIYNDDDSSQTRSPNERVDACLRVLAIRRVTDWTDALRAMPDEATAYAAGDSDRMLLSQGQLLPRADAEDLQTLVRHHRQNADSD